MSVLSLTELSDAFRAELNKPKNPEPECEGLIFRYSRDIWIGSDNDVNFRDRFRWNKTLSCDGCDKCGWMWDDMREIMCDEGLILPDNPKQDQLYTLIVTNITTDWESGYVDGYDLEFVEVKDVRDNQDDDVS